MKKIIGYVLVAIAVLNVLGFIYMLITNGNKFNDNSGYFLKKIIFAIGIGGLGIYLIRTTKKEENSIVPKNNSEIEKNKFRL